MALDSGDLEAQNELLTVKENQLQDGPSFQYTTLKQANSIRLLTILPGTLEDNLKCYIYEADLDEDPEFEALSYCWGDCNNPIPVMINNMILPIGPNLHSALVHLRLEDESRVIWADAICINQSDLAERSQQVSIMGKIYSSATKTVIWLGSLTEDLSGVLSEWKMIVEHVMAQDESLASKKRSNFVPQKSVMKALRILSHPWWSRVWVVQEFALSKSVVVHCGSDCISWEDLLIGVVAVMQNDWVRASTMGFLNPHTYDMFLTFIMIQDVIKQEVENPYHRLTDLLAFLHGRHATDPRDHIYASLGMLGDYDYGIVPDYTSSVTDVFINSTGCILERAGRLDILGHCQPSLSTSNPLDLPSWVPNWIPTDELTSPLCSDGHPSEYSASRHSSATLKTLDNGRTILLSGHLFDVVTELALPLKELKLRGLGSFATRSDALRQRFKEDPDNLSFGDIFSTLYSNLTTSYKDLEKFLPFVTFFLDWEKFANVHDTETQSATNETHLEVYFRTLCGDWMADGLETTKASFQKWFDTFDPVRIVTEPNSLASKLPNFVTDAIIFRALRQFMERKDPDFSLNMSYMTNRRLGRTASGYLCAVPETTVVGDQVWLFKGGRVPLIVRPDGDGYLKLVGESFVYGIMKGEKFKEDQCVEFRMR